MAEKDGLDWRDGVPVSRRFDDPYYSLQGGWDEAGYVFVAGNGLPEWLRPGFHVAELGFGTGLNLLRLVAAAPTSCPFRFTSFEAHPLTASDTETALAVFPEAAALAGPMLEALARGATRWQMGNTDVEVVIGDARETLPRWDGTADAWFLDGFAPARNPELWNAELIDAVGRHTAPGGTFATYTAAGEVRRVLAGAGFTVERRPGFGRKRHMTVGRMP